MMQDRYICPECGKKEVEEVNACGASNYFCNACKKLISSQRINKENVNEKYKNKEASI